MSTQQTLADSQSHSSLGKRGNSGTEVQPRKQLKRATSGDIRAAANELDVADLEQRISAVADCHAREKLEHVLKEWEWNIKFLQYPSSDPRWAQGLLTFRFPIALPTCQSLDPSLRTANSVLDRIASLYDEVAGTRSTSSEFAKPPIWKAEQRRFRKLLCLRPGERTGFPLATFCEAFGRYSSRISSNEPLPHNDADARNASVAACRLLEKMGDGFDDVSQRAKAFDECLFRCFGQGEWRPHYEMEGCYTKSVADYAFFGSCQPSQPYPVILRKDRNEPGDGDDPYMHIAQDYQILVSMIGAQASSGDATAERTLRRGVPVFLLCVDGPKFEVAGGFFDGISLVVEPLGPTASMLQDGTTSSRRQEYLARVLYALCRGTREIESLLNTAAITLALDHYQCGLPRIYRYCHHLDSNEDYELFVISQIVGTNLRHPLCRAGWQRPGSEREGFVKVKLTEGQYGVEVQRALASKGYAPHLYSIVKREGAPTAYVTEELDFWSWTDLYTLKRRWPYNYDDSQYAVRRSLDRILDFLEDARLVHGNLRPDHIMVNTIVNTKGWKEPIFSRDGSIAVKLIHFDWSGKSGEVFYPYQRDLNPIECSGSALPGVNGGPIEIGHDRLMLSGWFGELP